MVQIVLSEEQVQAIRGAEDGVELLDQSGAPVGIVHRGVTAEDLRIVRERRARGEPGVSIEELLHRVRSGKSDADT